MKHLRLFVFVDALGWKLAEHHNFLRDLLPVRSPVETVFGYSSTCDPTILTGCPPSEHSHFAFFAKATGPSPFRGLRALGCLPHKLAGNHRIRGRLSRWFGQRLGYTGYFQLYSVPFSILPYLDYTEKKDLYAPGGIRGGQRTIFDFWQATGKPWHCSNWRIGDEANFASLGNELDRGEIELAYLFIGQLDGVMHRVGPYAPEAGAAFAAFGQRLRALLGQASQRYERVSCAVFSDHGMSETQRTSDMLLRIKQLGLRYGQDYVAVWDSTMARFWFADDAARLRITAWLRDQPDGRVLEDEQLAAWGCLFPCRTYGELFYLLPPGTIFVPSFMNQNLVRGMHGYDPAHEECRASWLTNDAALGTPRHLADIFGVMQNAAQS